MINLNEETKLQEDLISCTDVIEVEKIKSKLIKISYKKKFIDGIKYLISNWSYNIDNETINLQPYKVITFNINNRYVVELDNFLHKRGGNNLLNAISKINGDILCGFSLNYDTIRLCIPETFIENDFDILMIINDLEKSVTLN